jgi:hypothetical protein
LSQAVEAGISVIVSDPTRFQPVGDGIRIFRMKRFPYYLFYRFHEARQHFRIVAMMHQRRKPDYWRDRL